MEMAKHERTAVERSEAARRAALSRKHHRGGRPRKDDTPEKSCKVYGRDLDVFAAYARLRGVSVKGALNVVAHLLINGGTVPARPQLALSGWRRIGW